jgi:hypothetical protein
MALAYMSSNEEMEFNDELKDAMKKKLDPLLQDIVKSSSATLPIIIQTSDGLKDEDRRQVSDLGGRVKDDLYIINAFSAEMPTEGILKLVKKNRVLKIYYDAEVRAV